MKRRRFLVTSLAASAIAGPTRAGSSAPHSSANETSGREYYELRRYELRRGAKTRLMDEFLERALLPALKRLGIGPAGVFNTVIGPGSPALYLLMPFPSLEAVATLGARLNADAEFLRAGAPVLDAPSADPAYSRYQTSLLGAFEGMPRLEVPPAALEHRTRIYELRTYESHSKKANIKKIEMFNRGEIAIFRRTGLRPVFFGETLAGPHLPNLTYMLSFADMAEREKNWAAFVADPEWKKLSTAPGYTDGEIVSSISNAILSPTPYSEI